MDSFFCRVSAETLREGLPLFDVLGTGSRGLNFGLLMSDVRRLGSPSKVTGHGFQPQAYYVEIFYNRLSGNEPGIQLRAA